MPLCIHQKCFGMTELKISYHAGFVFTRNLSKIQKPSKYFKMEFWTTGRFFLEKNHLTDRCSAPILICTWLVYNKAQIFVSCPKRVPRRYHVLICSDLHFSTFPVILSLVHLKILCICVLMKILLYNCKYLKKTCRFVWWLNCCRAFAGHTIFKMTHPKRSLIFLKHLRVEKKTKLGLSSPKTTGHKRSLNGKYL